MFLEVQHLPTPNGTHYTYCATIPTQHKLIIASHVPCVGSVGQTWMCLVLRQCVACWFIITCNNLHLSGVPTLQTEPGNNASCSLAIGVVESKNSPLCFCRRLWRWATLETLYGTACEAVEWARFAAEAVSKHRYLCVVSAAVFTHT